MNRRLDTMAGRTGTRVARVIPPWAAAVLGTWVLGTVVLGIIAQRGLDGSLVAMVSHSAARSFLVCVAVGGPATFTALALRQVHRARIALCGGILAGTGAFAIVFASLHAGLAMVSAITPAGLALAAEFSAGFLLLARRPGDR